MGMKNPLGVIGALWMGLTLIGLIFSAFLDGPFHFLSGLNIFTHLAFFWALMSPGVIMCLIAAKKGD